MIQLQLLRNRCSFQSIDKFLRRFSQSICGLGDCLCVLSEMEADLERFGRIGDHFWILDVLV